MLPEFALPMAYGVVRSDLVLIVPSLVALVVSATAIAVAAYFRSPRHSGAGPGAPH